ncbi:amidase signature domain-containing protein [Xylogone sp. PMI_703]|nr:amidase signature domain-containing protein [Xylogone sp. PMI_703]
MKLGGFRFVAIAAFASGTLAVTCKRVDIPDLFTATIDDVQDGLTCGNFTSVQLTQAYLARISEVNDILHAVIETNPDALEIAAQLDALRASGSVLGPLHGVPILIKDNIATDDKMNNTAGSFSLLGAKVPTDSTIAANLRKAGAIILGKSNLSQWANYRSSNSTNGWTARGGQTTGAYYHNQDPSGSSSGSGVGSSIGLAMASLGSETSGSIISPSSRNNLVGIKPTVGLTSRYLVIPISSTQDTVGPMARTVRDAAYLLSAIAGKDANDNYTLVSPFKPGYKFESSCKHNALKGMRIGIPRNGFSASSSNAPEIDAFNASIQVFIDQGATIVDNANFPNLTEYRTANSGIVLGTEFEFGVAEYFNSLTYNPYNIHSLQDLINFTETFPAEDYPDRNVNTWITAINNNLTLDSAAFQLARANDLVAGSTATILGALEQYNLDALIMPSSSSPGVAAIAGYPIVTVPLGFYPGSTPPTTNSRGTLVTRGPHFPFGISFLGRKFSEPTLIQAAYGFEQATKVRDQVQPYIIPNFQLADFI